MPSELIAHAGGQLFGNSLDRRPRQRLTLCGGCGRTYDPDLWATMLMLARGLERSSALSAADSARSNRWAPRPAIRAQGIDSFLRLVTVRTVTSE